MNIYFRIFCRWVGHIFVKAVTLGKVNLDRGNSSESAVTEFIGFSVLVALAVLISFLTSPS